MMKKAVPLALLIGSSLAVDNFLTPSTWTAGSTTADTTTAANCCIFTGAVSINAAQSISGTANGVQTTAGACSGYANANSVSGSTNLFSGTTLTIPLLVPTVANGGPAAKTGSLQTAAGTITWTKDAQQGAANTNADGSVLTFQTSPGNTASAANNDICKQTLTRTIATAPTSDFTGSWSIGAATGDATQCCFLQTTSNLAIAVTSGLTRASGVNTADTTPCASSIVGQNAAYNVILEQGSSTSVAQTILSGTSSDDTFTLSTDKNTITFRPKNSQSCSQTLTKVSSSGVHLASIMTPVVVGGAVLGLVVV